MLHVMTWNGMVWYGGENWLHCQRKNILSPFWICYFYCFSFQFTAVVCFYWRHKRHFRWWWYTQILKALCNSQNSLHFTKLNERNDGFLNKYSIGKGIAIEFVERLKKKWQQRRQSNPLNFDGRLSLFVVSFFIF